MNERTPKPRSVAPIFRSASLQQAVPPGGHVGDDEELLTSWSLGLLSPAEEAKLHKHLAACAPCRAVVAELARAGGLPEPEPMPAPVPVATKSRKMWWAAGTLLALAAAVLIAIAIVQPDSGARQLAAVTAALDRGDFGDALRRLDEAAPSLAPERRDQARHLYEATAGSLLLASDFDAAETATRHADSAGLRSGRLANIAVQAGGKIAAELTISRGGSVSDYRLPLSPGGMSKGLKIPNEARTLLLNKLAGRYSGDVAILTNLGEQLLRDQKYAESADAFRQALNAVPTAVPARLGLGLAEFAREKYAEALREFEAILAVEPTHAAALVNAGACQAHLKNRAAAEELWRRAVPLVTDPKLVVALKAQLGEK